MSSPSGTPGPEPGRSMPGKATRSARARFERAYGAGPVDLIVTAAGLALGGYVASILVHVSHWKMILVWFVGAIIAHDLVVFPLYAAIDRAFSGLVSRRTKAPLVPWRNHVRAPVVISAILLLITFPLVFNLSEKTYHRAQGLTTSVYLQRWVTVAGALFVGSAVIYGLRVVLALRRRRVVDVPAT